METQTIHLAKDGDSLFGLRAVACGIKCHEGMIGHYQADKVTCGACKKTKQFKQLAEAERKEREFPEIRVKDVTDCVDWYNTLIGARVVGVMEGGTTVMKPVGLKLEKDNKFYWIDLQE